MAQYDGMVLTNDGINLLAKCQLGQKIEFTKVLIGDGRVPEGKTFQEMTALVNTKLALGIQNVDFVEDGEHIKACQWIQKEKGKLLILIVPDDGFTDKDKEFVVDETIKRVGENNMDIDVKLTKLDELRLTKRGKFRLIVNEIPKENNLV